MAGIGHRLLIAALLATGITAQSTESPEDGPTQKMRWPEDAQRRICRVGEVTYTLSDLIDHLTKRHWPPMREFVGTAAGKLYFDHPLLARWVRQFADVKTLEDEARRREIPQERIDEALDATFEQAFALALEQYRQERQNQGRPVELTPERVESRRAEFRRHFGLQTEVDGWLNALAPLTPAEADGLLREFYTENARIFGGVVDLAQILIQHRDPRTLELLRGPAREEALAKVEDVRTRLEADGSNFEEVARILSEDRRTASRGGVLNNVERFDQRLPAAICRTAWLMADGKFTGPIETPFGLVFVKRLAFRQQYYVPIFTEDFKPTVQAGKQRLEHEDLVFDLRDRLGVKLFY